MVAHLDEAEAEHALISSVHQALRQRFAQIHDESKELPKATRDKRFESERDRWRLAFSGAKTQEQVRFALADLWSRGGPNKELRARWENILPLLRKESWQTARDLALVALASYASQREVESPDNETSAESDQDTGRSAS